MPKSSAAINSAPALKGNLTPGCRFLKTKGKSKVTYTELRELEWELASEERLDATELTSEEMLEVADARAELRLALALDPVDEEPPTREERDEVVDWPMTDEAKAKTTTFLICILRVDVCC